MVTGQDSLKLTLNASVPVDNDAPEGRYSVVVRFVVDVDGSISDITPLTAHGYGLEQEAVRVIKKSKNWETGIPEWRTCESIQKKQGDSV